MSVCVFSLASMNAISVLVRYTPAAADVSAAPPNANLLHIGMCIVNANGGMQVCAVNAFGDVLVALTLLPRTEQCHELCRSVMASFTWQNSWVDKHTYIMRLVCLYIPHVCFAANMQSPSHRIVDCICALEANRKPETHVNDENVDINYRRRRRQRSFVHPPRTSQAFSDQKPKDRHAFRRPDMCGPARSICDRVFGPLMPSVARRRNEHLMCLLRRLQLVQKLGYPISIRVIMHWVENVQRLGRVCLFGSARGWVGLISRMMMGTRAVNKSSACWRRWSMVGNVGGHL